MKTKSVVYILMLAASTSFAADELKPIPFVVACKVSPIGTMDRFDDVGRTASGDSIGYSTGDIVDVNGQVRSYVIEDAGSYKYLGTTKPTNTGSVLRISLCTTGNYCRDAGTTSVSKEYVLNTISDADVTVESKDTGLSIRCRGIVANNFIEVVSFVKSGGLNP
ncbi:MAG: hypothetical protein HYW49_08385 [Deltaproteobacteria bacterium]|nr:hypothetical protein [Deltaproteobacteria bacterium]